MARIERGDGGYVWHFLRWLYARWVQVLALVDLLGPDGRPSFSKMATVYALYLAASLPSDTVAIIALCAAFGPRVLVAALRSWRGTTATSATRQSVDVAIVDKRRDLGNLEFEPTP